ncbi:MAG: hypothetical protein JW889_14690 [Verrucomicrobia bacterium]|nr:hypothetical protein [Verrucomicrobiota bacterium]
MNANTKALTRRAGPLPGLPDSQDGSALAVVIILALVSAVMVAAFMGMTLTEHIIVNSNSDSIAAFHVAEAGLETGARLLYEDMINTPQGYEPSWRDGRFYLDSYDGGYLAEDGVTYYPTFRVLAGPVSFADGTYTIEMANIAGLDDAIWVRSTGTVRGKTRAVLSKYRIKNLNPWNNAIFAGAGAAGRTINGCVDIRGSVHILGEDTFHGTVMEMSGSAYIGNNYIGLPLTLASRIPMIAEMVDGRLFETLDTEVRVRYGQVSISGSADIGEDGTTEIVYDAQIGEAKMRVDGTYVTDGWTGNKGASAVYSDNGTDEPYDLPVDTFDGFPKLSDPYEGYDSYTDYLRDHGLVISDPAALAQLADITRSSSFSYSNEYGSISADGNGNLTVSGVIVIEGDLGIGKDNSGMMYYQGSACVLATGNVTVENDLIVRAGEMFPTMSILGVMTPNTILFDRAQLYVQGIFYAETQITSTKQTIVTGTFFSDYFDMGTNVPNIFQVPSVLYHLPQGMFGSFNVFSLRRDCFREVDLGATE